MTAIVNKYPSARFERIAAEVFACLIAGEMRIILGPGVGLANGGVPFDVPIDVIPFELRMPNTPLWVQLDENIKIVRVWQREE